ncbi:uncharacterized protein LOC111872978 [Cryptotermes secundus]|uniref:uncharacterized protein LOC111872978 n=1 Tax=Cryptotermes secundus TaxID=105785 RepID=UPI000CD7AD28|nr:uncharacterized protein LOC111872978 [Cryptotermes secundus]
MSLIQEGNSHDPALVQQTSPTRVRHSHRQHRASHSHHRHRVRHSHRQHRAPPVHSSPPSTRHSSAVNSAGTSTASDLHAGPWLSPAFEVLSFEKNLPGRWRQQVTLVATAPPPSELCVSVCCHATR